MQHVFTVIGFIACAITATYAFIKCIEVFYFFRDFRESVTKSLSKIEERLRTLKP